MRHYSLFMLLQRRRYDVAYARVYKYTTCDLDLEINVTHTYFRMLSHGLPPTKLRAAGLSFRGYLIFKDRTRDGSKTLIDMKEYSLSRLLLRLIILFTENLSRCLTQVERTHRTTPRSNTRDETTLSANHP